MKKMRPQASPLSLLLGLALCAPLSALLSAALVACDGPDPGVDAGPEVDAGPGSDAGPEADAGPEVDAGPPEGCTRSTESGEVIGVEEAALCRYSGIPYVAPPVGALRFRPPTPHPGWSEPLVADAFGPVCPQREGNASGDPIVGDEDCLTLNIVSPRSPGPHPVMVYIHGGAFIQGAGSSPLFEGSALVGASEAVLVTFNYRVGALGFLATDEMIAEDPEGGAGNYGIRDQVAALQWVRRNIAAFGGDPARVTLFGESAGASSICVHLGSPGSDGLFARAIMQSGGGCSGYPALSASAPGSQSAVERSASVVAAAGCDGAADPLACLRDLSAEALTRALYDGAGTSGLGLPAAGPNIDGVLLSGQPYDRIAAGEADVPLIVGSNADESKIFLLGVPVPTEAAYESLVRGALPAFADDLLALYPVADFSSPKDAYENLFSDVAFICPALSVAEAASSGAPSYSYHFTHILSGAAGSFGSFHGIELFHLFGTFSELSGYSPREPDLAVASDIREAWSHFANEEELSAGGTLWPPLAAGGAPSIFLFEAPGVVTSEIREGRCARLREIGVVR